jgi:hypothetical protein
MAGCPALFGESIARNFLAPAMLDDRFFSLLTFMHIAAADPAVRPVDPSAAYQPAEDQPGTRACARHLLMMVALSFAQPALSQGPADLATVPAVVALDWFYLPAYPLLDIWSGRTLWSFVGALSLLVAALPWLPPMRRVAVAAVDLDNCNGCKRCAEDCPFGAIVMGPRTDGLPFEQEAVVDPRSALAAASAPVLA